MSIKSFALIAATIAVTATGASASNYFENGRTLDAGDTIELGTVRADAGGVVEIYDYHTGQAGALLGSEQLNAGVNTNVRIDTGLPTNRDVIAVLKVDGETVVSKVYDIDS